MTVTRMPGPRGDWLAGNLVGYENDRLGWLTAAHRDHGPIVRFDRTTTIVSDPEVVRSVLMNRSGSFAIRHNLLQERIPDDEIGSWVDVRRLLNPHLRLRAVSASAPLVAEVTRAAVAETRGQPVDAMRLFERITATVVATQFFGPRHRDLPDLAGDLLEALGSVIGNPLAAPAWFPTPSRRRIASCMRRMQGVVDELLTERLAHPERYDDLVAQLVRDRPGGWVPVDRQRVTRALVGALLAGHRVPAAAAGWAQLLAVEHPDRAAGLRHEAATLAALIDQRLPVTPGALPATASFLAETLRLYPPTWLITRTLTDPADVGGYDLPAGHTVLVSPYVLHRDPAAYDDPTAFDPDRWRTHGSRAGAVGGAPLYLPYGLGARACPGRDLAALTLSVVLLTTLHHFTVRRTPGPVVPDPRTTLVPRGLELSFAPVA